MVIMTEFFVSTVLDFEIFKRHLSNANEIFFSGCFHKLSQFMSNMVAYIFQLPHKARFHVRGAQNVNNSSFFHRAFNLNSF
jgi:hypothetical protein